MLDSCSDVCVDISALVHFLLSNKNNIETTYINFTSIAEDTVVITEAAIAESAMELLPLLFSEYECYFGANDEEDSTLKKHTNLNRIPDKRYTNTTTHRIWTESFDMQKRMTFRLQLFLVQMVSCEKNSKNSITLLN